MDRTQTEPDVVLLSGDFQLSYAVFTNQELPVAHVVDPEIVADRGDIQKARPCYRILNDKPNSIRALQKNISGCTAILLDFSGLGTPKRGCNLHGRARKGCDSAVAVQYRKQLFTSGHLRINDLWGNR